MKISSSGFLQTFFAIFVFIFCTSTVVAENTASGSLTVDGKTTAIKFAYADSYDGDITIVLTDSPIAKEMVPDGVFNLGKQGKFKGIMLVVSSKSKEL